MKGHIVDGMMKRAYKPLSLARPITIKYVDGTVLEIPVSCVTRTGQLKAGVAKAVLLKNYEKLKNQYGVTVNRTAA